ncbi:MAG: peptidyl-prolyl cis-trans isomerase [Candidatus Omnitrophica bacterium]|nr:peptidyl-prolyl cis-trans isomerase [Candidatus Omnitrophota bacterium]
MAAMAGCEKLSSLFQGGPEEATATPAAPAAPSPGQASRPPVLPGDVVANVNGVPLSKTDIETRVEELKTLVTNLGQPWTPLTAEQMDAVLDELVNNELMSQEAVARGLDRQLATQRRFEFLRRTFFAQEWLQWNRARLEVSSAEVEQYYETNKPGFRTPERRKLRQLTAASEEQAKQALSQLLGGTSDFASLAQQSSLAPSAPQGGLLAQWVVREAEKVLLGPAEAESTVSLDPALEAAAFAIDQVNGLSSYVKGADTRYHLFQLVERQAEHQRPLTELWDQIKNFLLFQKLQGSLEQLKSKAKIERFPERLDAITQE